MDRAVPHVAFSAVHIASVMLGIYGPADLAPPAWGIALVVIAAWFVAVRRAKPGLRLGRTDDRVSARPSAGNALPLSHLCPLTLAGLSWHQGTTCHRGPPPFPSPPRRPTGSRPARCAAGERRQLGARAAARLRRRRGVAAAHPSRGRSIVDAGLTDGHRTLWCALRVGRHVFELDSRQTSGVPRLAPPRMARALWAEQERQDVVAGFNLGVSRIGAPSWWKTELC